MMSLHYNYQINVYVESFDTPLPVQQHIGIFQCLILHHGKTMPPCKSCNRSGHKVGDERCPAKPSDTILAFRGYGHPFSNHYACDITVNGATFKSVEHAYFHQMATEMGKHDLADDIKNARHAGVAKRLSHDIAPDEDRWAWELDNIEIMEKLLQAKLKQCPAFKQCLIESTGMVIAEATNSKIWATGMTPYVTERTSKEYWPGRNLLGAMLTEMSQELAGKQPMECTRESGELVSDDPSPNDVTLVQHPQDSIHQLNSQPELPASQVDYLTTQTSQSDPITQASQSDPITQDSQTTSQNNQQNQVKALQSGQQSGQHNAPVTSDPSAAKVTSSSPSANASSNASSNESSHTSRTKQKNPAFNRTLEAFQHTAEDIVPQDTRLIKIGLKKSSHQT